MSKIFDERLVPEESTEDNIIYNEHLIRYRLAGEFVKEKIVLDIACGSGYGAKILAKKGAKEVIAIDIDEKSIKKAKENFREEKVEYIVGDCLDTKLEDKKFDTIVSFETIEHLKNQDKYLEELKRVLKDDGLIVVSTPNREVFGNKNPFHVHEFTKKEFEELLKKYFQYVQIFEQRNGLASSIQISGLEEAKVYFGEKTKPWYYIAFCSNIEIASDLLKKNYLSVNYVALENINNNLGFKLVNRIYSFLIKIPGIKKLFKIIKK